MRSLAVLVDVEGLSREVGKAMSVLGGRLLELHFTVQEVQSTKDRLGLGTLGRHRGWWFGRAGLTFPLRLSSCLAAWGDGLINHGWSELKLPGCLNCHCPEQTEGLNQEIAKNCQVSRGKLDFSQVYC